MSYLIVTLHSIHECLIRHDLSLSVKEGLEAILHCLKLLFTDL